MYAFQIGDLERVMKIPVPIRKWLIVRWNKQKEKEYKLTNPASDVSKPLPESERIKMIKKAAEASNSPSAQFMHSRRNASK